MPKGTAQEMTPILSIAPQNIGKLDPNDTSSICSLWTVFSKCAQNLENGRRLENISWRLWNRELLYHDPSVPDLELQLPEKPGAHDDEMVSSSDTLPSLDQVPRLSSSTDSLLSRRKHKKQLSSEQLQELFSLFKPGQEEDWKKASPKSGAFSSRHAAAKVPTKPTADTNRSNSGSKPSDSQSPGGDVEASQEPVALSNEKSEIPPPSSTQNTASPPMAPQSSSPKNHQKQHLFNNNQTKHETTNTNQVSQLTANLASNPATTSITNPQTPQLAPSTRAASRPSLFQRSTQMRTSPPKYHQADDDDDEDDDSSDFFSDDDESDFESDQDSYRNKNDDSSTTAVENSNNKKGLAYSNRTNTSTSIVRGFEPGNVSVSVINRSPVNTQGLSGEKDGNSMSGFKDDDTNNASFDRQKHNNDNQDLQRPVHTQAKVPREKMFFIESSPSDNEDFAANSISTNGSDKTKNRASSKPKSATNSTRQRGGSKSAVGVGAGSQSHGSSRLAKSQEDYEEAIDDGSDSDWDSVDDESDSSYDEPVFTRDDEHKKPLVKPSLLSSLFLNDHDRLQRDQQRQKLSMRQPQQPALQEQKQEQKQPPKSRLSAQPINPTENLLNVTAHTHAPPPQPMSPRTTRRNMIQNELSESLRRNLYMERQRQRQPTAALNSSSSLSKKPLKKSLTFSNVVGMDESRKNSITDDDGDGDGDDNNNNKTADSDQQLTRNKSAQDLLASKMVSWKEDMEDDNLDFNYHARGW